MPQPPATAKATAAAAASPNPGTGAPVLAAWLLVRRRNAFLSFAKRRYVVLTDDHVLRVDSTPVLHLVDCRITTHASSKLIDLTPANSAGLPIRIFTDSPFQYSKWRLALQATADASIRRFYRLDMSRCIGVGVHGVVRLARPSALPMREPSHDSFNASDYLSTESNRLHRYMSRGPEPNTTQRRVPPAAYSTRSEMDHPSMPSPLLLPSSSLLSPLTADVHHYSDSDAARPRADSAQRATLARTRSRDGPRRIFKRRILSVAGDRDSVDIDPDACMPETPTTTDASVPASKLDKRYLRQPSHLHTIASTAPSHADLLHDAASATSAAPSLASATNAPVAVKTVSRNGNNAVTVASELLFGLARLNHFAIVKVMDVFLAVSDVHVVMEYCSGGTVAQFVHEHGPLSETDAKLVFAPVLKAVGYLHASGMVHWDVTPTNVLFAGEAPPYEPKLIDFGTARPIDPANGRVPQQHDVFLEKGKVASLACASPELLTSKAHRYAAKADMWQLGCLLYFLLFGSLPFAGKGGGAAGNVSTTILAFCKKRSPERRRYLFGDEDIGEFDGVSEDAKLLILKLLCPNPRMRPNALHCLKEFSFLSPMKS